MPCGIIVSGGFGCRCKSGKDTQFEHVIEMLKMHRKEVITDNQWKTG
jgi:hypothetical protein